jgi:uncharacterized protein with HEPN domain
MPFKTPAGALEDIRRQIELARSFVEGFTFETFQADRRTVYAVIRCLEIISEASRRLPDEVKARHPHIPWPNIAGAGNVYRHNYEDVADDMVWRTVQDSLGPLLATVEAELQMP